VAKALKQIEQDIRALSSDEKLQLLRTLLAELDSPPDANVEKAWLETSQRRYRELVEGKVQGAPDLSDLRDCVLASADEVRVPPGSGAGTARSRRLLRTSQSSTQ
jgi:hypothetical protein